MRCCAAESAGSVSDGTDPNDVPGGSAPEEPVQLPQFTAVDQSGSDFSLAQLQVCFPCKPLHHWLSYSTSCACLRDRCM